MTEFIAPMLAKSTTREKLETGNWSGYTLEPKHDGMRAIAIRSSEGVSILSRTGKSQEEKVPHLVEELMQYPVGTVLDAEIAWVKESPRLYDESIPVVDFNRTMRVMGSLPSKAIRKQEEYGQGVSLLVFDVLKFEGASLIEEAWSTRRKYLTELFKADESKLVRSNPVFAEVNLSVYDGLVELGIEGAILKSDKARYVPGKRPNLTWYKVKVDSTYDVVVMGFYGGRGKHEGRLGGLVFGAYDESGTLQRVGKAGGGFSDTLREEIWNNQEEWLHRVVEVKANELVGSGAFRTPRHPAFLHARTDRTKESCSLEQFRIEE